MVQLAGDYGGSTGNTRYTKFNPYQLAGVQPVVAPVDPLQNLANPVYPTTQQKPVASTQMRKTAAVAPAPAPIPVPNETGQFSLAAAAPAPPPVKYGFNAGAGEVDPTAGDSVFASTQDHLQRALAQFLASQQRESGLIDSNATEQNDMLERQKGIDLKELLENFAGRGLAYSGRYADDDKELGNAYARRLAAIAQGVTNQKASQAERKADFQEEQRLALETARAESLARRLAAQGG